MRESKLKKLYRNICLIEYNLKTAEKIIEENHNLKEQINYLENKLDLVIKEIDTTKKICNDNLYATILHDSIKNNSWLKTNLSLSSGAIGYNFAYILYRTLNDIKPNSILELGLGQSTKIITDYVKVHKNVNHDVVEHNPEWIEFFKKSTDMSEFQHVHLLENYKKKYKGKTLNAYKNFSGEFKNKKYNLICIDGPVGHGQEYARMDILDILPECLEKEFVIILDDCERIGEQNTIKLIEEKLNNNKINYCSGYHYWGQTCVYICTSENLEFLCHI